MNPYDLTSPKVYADGELFDAAKANEFSNHTALGYSAGGNVPGAAGAAVLTALDWLPGVADFAGGVDGVWVSGWGNVVQLRLTLTLTVAVTVPASGNVADQLLGTIRAPEWQPPHWITGGSISSGRGGSFCMTDEGGIYLAHVMGSGNITQGSVLSLGFTYVRRGLTA